MKIYENYTEDIQIWEYKYTIYIYRQGASKNIGKNLLYPDDFDIFLELLIKYSDNLLDDIKIDTYFIACMKWYFDNYFKVENEK